MSKDRSYKSWGDWYGRTSDHYRSKYKSKFGWEKELDEEDSYSSYFWKPKSTDEIIKKAHETARSFIVILNPPFKVNIQISEGEGSFTDGRKVCVSTKIFDLSEDIYDNSEKLDVFCGLAIHEACHLLYTKFSEWTGSDDIRNPVIKFIANIIEDERIEDAI